MRCSKLIPDLRQLLISFAGLTFLLPVVVHAQDPPARHDLRPSTVIGLSEEQDDFFADIGALAAAPDGRLVVVDPLSRSVVSYDRHGLRVGRFGRQGYGPGEFQAPWRVAVTTDGRVVVRDLGLERYSVHLLSGEYQFSVPAKYDGSYWDAMWSGPGGSVLDLRRRWEAPEEPARVVQVSGRNASDTLAVVARIPNIRRRDLELPDRSGFVDQPFAGEYHWTVSGDGGIWWAEGQEARIDGLAASGMREVIALEPMNLPISAARADSALSDKEREIRDKLAGSGHAVGEWIERIRTPSTYPEVSGLFPGQSGHLMVPRAWPGRGSTLRIDIVTVDGQVAAHLHLPQGPDYLPELMVTDGTVLWIAAQTDLGVKYLIAHELPEGLWRS